MATKEQYARWCIQLIEGDDHFIDELYIELFDDGFIDENQEQVWEDDED